jgi:hypothetical protein
MPTRRTVFAASKIPDENGVEGKMFQEYSMHIIMAILKKDVSSVPRGERMLT